MGSVWVDVDQGRRSLDWHVALTELEKVPEITEAGRALGSRIANDLEQFFGDGWLAKAAPPRSPEWISGLPRFWPSLGLAGAYVNVIELWASLRLLVDRHVRGVRMLRDHLRTNFDEVGFQHGLIQARLGTQALVSGHSVILEPRKYDGNPGDLAVYAAGNEVFLEVKTFNPDHAFVTTDRSVARVMELIRRLEVEFDVYWSGTISEAELLPERAEALRAAAAAAHSTGTPQHLGDGEDPLTVGPGPQPDGARLSGPLMESSHGPRLLRDMGRKAVQTRAAGAAWIWLQDNRNALWPMSEFARYPLRRKIDVFADLAGTVFDTHPHVVGVVLTSANMAGEQVDDEDVETPRGYGIRRALPGRRARESIVLHRTLIVPGQLGVVLSLCTDEPSWIDGALGCLDVPGGLSSLTTFHTRPPSQRRRSSGIYLP